MFSQPLKWHGGKSYLAKKIIELMPPRVKNPNNPSPDDPGWCHYVEPFFGGGAVLFQLDPTGISETVNDLNHGLTNFWRVLRNPKWFSEFTQRIEAMPFSKVEWKDSFAVMTGDNVEDALRFFVRYRQSRQGLGKCFSTLVRNRTRKGMQEQVSSWLSAVDGLQDAHARLNRVAILNDEADKVIRQQDGPRTLFYLDPPYLHETRHESATDAYECEMTADDHEKLLNTLAGIEGRFILSGYPSELYAKAAEAYGWHHVDFEIDNKSSGAKVKEKKTERVWMNFQP